MDKVMSRILFFVTFLMSMPSMARNMWCGGTLEGVYIEAAGNLMIRGTWRNDWTKICNVNSDPVTCSLWASYAANALQNQNSVTLMYSGDFKCDTIDIYADAPTPLYFMLNKKSIN